MVTRPDLSERNRNNIGIKNHAFGKKPWNFGTKGLCKSNSGSFKKGMIPWNKKLKEISKELLKDISPETRQILLTEQEKCVIAIAKLEKQRLERIAQEKIEDANKPKPKERNGNMFGMLMCVIEGKLISCKKNKAFCSHWKFCHNNV